MDSALQGKQKTSAEEKDVLESVCVFVFGKDVELNHSSLPVPAAPREMCDGQPGRNVSNVR